MSISTAMRARYEPNSYVLMFEVANATGLNKNRSADAIAVSLWPSRGIEIIGFEFKVSRADWLKELKDPAKAESIYRYCHQWYLVVSDASIVKHGELPKTWGQLTLQKDGRLKESIKAPKLEPAPLTMEFVASMLRSAAKPVLQNDRAALGAEYGRGFKDGKDSVASSIKYIEEEVETLRNEREEFKKASGISIHHHWKGPADIGRVVREVLDGKHKRDAEEIQRIREMASDIVARIDRSGITTNGAAT